MIAPGDAVLALAALAGAVAVATSTGVALGRLGLARLADRALAAHVAFLGLALATLVASFVVADLSIAYVWDHTWVGFPPHYRLAGLWAGGEGTLLLWALPAAAALLVEARTPRGSPAFRHAWRALVVGVTAAFALALAAHGLFAPTDPMLAAAVPEGRGMPESLVTPLMIIHPPLQFVGYALVLVAAGAAVSGLLTGDGAWISRAFAWARPAWLVATVGLGLGGLWAYYALSFGGFWAWDPVETANLMPWLALTAFLHAAKPRERFGDLALAAPTLLAGAFWLTLFASFATRSGLWVSVHAFTDPSTRFDPDPLARTLALVGTSEPTALFAALLAAAALVTAAALVLAASRGGPLALPARAVAGALGLAAGVAAVDPRLALGALFEAGAALPLLGPAEGVGLLALAILAGPVIALHLARDGDAPMPDILSQRALLAAAAALLGLAAAVAFIVNFQVVNAIDRSPFDERAPFVAIPLVMVLTVALASRTLVRRGALALAAGGLLLGLAGFASFPDRAVVALALPVLAAGAVAAFLRMLVAARAPGGSRRRDIGGALALAAAILNMAFWSNPPTALGGLGAFLLGFGLAAAAFVASALALAGAAPRVARLAPWLALAGPALPLAAVAAVLLARSASGTRTFAEALPNLRHAGMHLAHLALVFGLLGYAVSTYGAATGAFAEVAPGETVAVGAWTFTFAGVESREGVGFTERVAVELDAARDGARVATLPVALEWSHLPPIGQYVARLHVERTLLEDVYVHPARFRTADDGWVEPRPGAFERFSSDRVTAAAFEVRVLPLMTFVWSGLTLMAFGMTLVVAAAALERRAGRRSAPRARPLAVVAREK